MANVYVSFLGTSDYVECIYHRNGHEFPSARFVQEATIRLCCGTWGPDDRIFVFTTEDAYRKNWLDNGHVERGTGLTLQRKGLEHCIRDLSLPCVVENVPIPEGKSEEEIWDIFQALIDRIHPGDEIIIDITHAFRSIPMLAIVVLNYAKVMKAIKVKGIYYGAFEVLGTIAEAGAMSPESRRVPIFDLTAFDSLLEWSFAVDRFVKGGDGSRVSILAHDTVKPVLSTTRGADEGAVSIRNLADRLREFTEGLSTCRGPKIVGLATALKESLRKCEGLNMVKPFSPLMNIIAEQLQIFHGDESADGIAAARWCLNHGLIQQGYTILQETLLSHFLRSVGRDPRVRMDREVASGAVHVFLQKKSTKESEKLLNSNLSTVENITEYLRRHRDLAKVFQKTTPYRNDINHAGYSLKTRPSGKFRAKLEELVNETERLLEMTKSEDLLEPDKQNISED